MKRRACLRCGKPAESEDGCQVCGHPFQLSCPHCKKRFVNPDPHVCRIEGPKPTAAPSDSQDEYTLRMDGPPPDVLGDRYKIREVRFLPDGSMIGVLRGTGEEIVLGSAFREAAWALVEQGRIDPDTVLTIPGGSLWLTARALLSETEIARSKTTASPE